MISKFRLPNQIGLNIWRSSLRLKRNISDSIRTDKILLGSGPCTTSARVKRASMRDLSKYDDEFIKAISDIRKRLLALAGVSTPNSGFECVLIPGGGTSALESVISSTIAPNGKLLILRNGVYGRRLAQIARLNKIETEELTWPEDNPMNMPQIKDKLSADFNITDICMVHCETSSGMLHPIHEVGKLLKDSCDNRRFLVDAISTFGSTRIDVREVNAEFIVGSSGMCLQGLPGLGFVIAEKSALMYSEGQARSLTLDLFDQWKGMEEKNFRFTPPVQVIMAFHEALKELEEETLEGRIQRYRNNHKILVDGMLSLGFKLFIPQHESQSFSSAFFYPPSPNFQFQQFSDRLRDYGFVINGGSVCSANTFLLGTFGNLYPENIHQFLEAVRKTKQEMNL